MATATLAQLTEIAHRHSAAEAAGDLEGTLRTLEGEPVYELYPCGLQLRGMDRARRYYEHYFAHVAQRMVGYELLTEWVGPDGVAQEYDITARLDGGGTATFRVLGILKFGEKAMSGERLYAEETFLRILFGPLWSELEPA
jgi:hypothetical protein